MVVIVPRASEAVRRGERPDNPLRKRGVSECLDRRACPWYVERERARREKARERAAARRPNLRWRVFERDRGVCVDCGERHEEWDADHVVPLADDGAHVLENMATRCRVDHRSKTAQENRLRARRVYWTVPMGDDDGDERVGPGLSRGERYEDVPAGAVAADGANDPDRPFGAQPGWDAGA
jgi:5-methylcytosine-specific restriction endonuclease McrA